MSAKGSQTSSTVLSERNNHISTDVQNPGKEHASSGVKKNSLLKTLQKNLMVYAASALTFILGITVRGDWLLTLTLMSKQFGWNLLGEDDHRRNRTSLQNTTSHDQPHALWDELFRNVHLFACLSVSVTYISYFSLGGFLQWHYYIKRKEQAAEWKCQPDRWLTKENERHEILLGTFNMTIGGFLSGIIACYIVNGGRSTLFFDVSEYGWIYVILSTVTYFLFTDGMAYYVHRLSHRPWLYKNIHKHHHRYHTPTAFSAVAMHPAEFLVYQSILAVPAFVVPLHAVSFVGVLLYAYYYGMIDHSGINMDALWPWQPPSIFHDDHHRYFHCNFGFNTKIFDWYHDTLRLKSRDYGEDIFGGKGREKKE